MTLTPECHVPDLELGAKRFEQTAFNVGARKRRHANHPLASDW
jgi:hypothetical protein